MSDKTSWKSSSYLIYVTELTVQISGQITESRQNGLLLDSQCEQQRQHGTYNCRVVCKMSIMVSGCQAVTLSGRLIDRI